jgi:hypothetical protein
MSYDTKSIREFLLQRFNDSELTQFCFDYFLNVYHDFSDSWSKGDKIQALLEHCLVHGRFPDLMAALERERPAAFKGYFSAPARLAKPKSPPVAVRRNPRQVFISHAHQDAAFARRLADDLKAYNGPVWIAPDSIQPGEKWVEAINRGLEESGVFVLALTKTAVASPWVKDETNAAIELSKEGRLRFIPLEVESSSVPPLWRVFQRISFRDDYEAGLKELLAELGIEVEAETAVPSPGEEREAVKGWLERLLAVPVGVWGVTAVLLFLGVLALWQPWDRPNPEPNNRGTPAAGDLSVWRGFVEEADFQGEITVGESGTGSLPVSGTHTWLFRGGPIQLDILIEGRPNDNNLIRLYDDSSLNWDSFISPRGYVEGHLLEPGKQLIAFFDFPDDGDYIIVVTDLNGNGSEYQLILTESVPGEITVGETVEGLLVGDNPGVWQYQGESVVADIIFQPDRQESGLLFVADENGRELPNTYVDTATGDREYRLSNFRLEAGYAIVVRDTSNLGDTYTLTVE